MATRFNDSFRSLYYGIESAQSNAFGDSIFTSGLLIAGSAAPDKFLRQKPYNIKYSTNVEMFKRMYANGGMAALKSIVGKTSIKMSFSQDVIKLPYVSSTVWSTTTASGAPNVANVTSTILGPDWFEYLATCSMAAASYVVSGGHYNGVSMQDSPRKTQETASIAILERQEGALGQSGLAIIMCGATGNMKISGDGVGNTVRMDFDYEGPLYGIFDVSDKTLPLTEEAGLSPEAQINATLAATYTTASVGTKTAEALDTEKWELDLQNKSTLEPSYVSSSGSGFQRSRITSCSPVFKIDPYFALRANRDYWAAILEASSFSINIGIGSVITLKMPNLQLASGYSPSNRNNAMANPLVFNGFKGASVDGHGIQMLMGTTS